MSRRVPDIPTEDIGVVDPKGPVSQSQITDLVRLINDRISRLDRNVSNVITEITNTITQSAAATIPTVTILPGTASIGEPVIFQNALYTWTASGWVQAPQWIFQDTHANRLTDYDPITYAVGTLFFETDRQILYVVRFDSGTSQNQWYYVAGRYCDTFNNRPLLLTNFDVGLEFFATDYGFAERWVITGWIVLSGYARGPWTILATLAATPLSAGEVGLIVEETDYFHRFEWDGSAWRFAPGDVGSGYFVFGPQPEGGLWFPLDGSNHTIVTSDGTTDSRPTPDWNGTVATLMGGATNNTVAVASRATWDPSAQTDTEASHTHQIANNTDDTIVPSGFVVLASGQTTTAGSAHNHTLTDAHAKLNPPSVADGGLPAYFQMLGWMRG